MLPQVRVVRRHPLVQRRLFRLLLALQAPALHRVVHISEVEAHEVLPVLWSQVLLLFVALPITLAAQRLPALLLRPRLADLIPLQRLVEAVEPRPLVLLHFVVEAIGTEHFLLKGELLQNAGSHPHAQQHPLRRPHRAHCPLRPASDVNLGYLRSHGKNEEPVHFA